MARARLAEAPQPAARPSSVNPTPVRDKATPDWEVYTWQRAGIKGENGPQIILYGHNLQSAVRLLIGDHEIRLRSDSAGRTAWGPAPQGAVAELPLILFIGNDIDTLDEWYSRAKLYPTYKVLDMEVAWQSIIAPGTVPDLSGREVKALRIKLILTDVRNYSSPKQLFVGSCVIPNQQIVVEGDTLNVYVFHYEDIDAPVPIAIDIGDGVRVMAPRMLEIPD